jgi:Tfp pilus assembly protein PilO
MTTTNRWVAAAVAAAVALVAASWFLLISPQRSQAAELREQATAQQATNDMIRLRTQQMKAQFASLPQRRAQLAEIQQQLPNSPDLSALLRQLSTFADDAGVSVDSISPAQPQPLAMGTSAGTSAASSTGVQSIATTMVVKGGYAELTLFLQKLQGSMRRAVLVENLNLVPGDKADTSDSSTSLTMTLTGKAFVLTTAADPTGTSAGTTGTGATAGTGTTGTGATAGTGAATGGSATTTTAK